MEDEVHFLTSCSAYTEEWRRLFDIAAAHIPSFQENYPDGQFELLMYCNDIPVIHQLTVSACMYEAERVISTVVCCIVSLVSFVDNWLPWPKMSLSHSFILFPAHFASYFRSVFLRFGFHSSPWWHHRLITRTGIGRRHPSLQRDEIATGVERLLRTALPTDRKRKIQTFCGFFGTFKD